MPWRGTEGLGAGDDTTFDLARPSAGRSVPDASAGRPRSFVRLTADARTGTIPGFATAGIPAAAVATLTVCHRHAPVVSAGGRASAGDDAHRGRRTADPPFPRGLHRETHAHRLPGAHCSH